MQISRRQVIGMIGAVGALGALSACAGPGSTSASKGGFKPPASGSVEGDISFAHWRGEDKEEFDALIKQFVSEYGSVSVKQDISTSDDYNSQGLQKLRRGKSGDAYATFRGPQFNEFAKAGLHTDLSGIDAVGRLEPGLLEAGQYEGKQLGLPYQVVFPMPLVNLDLLDAADGDLAPKDWDGFMGLLDALATSGVTPLAWPGGDPGNAGQLFNSMVLNNGPSVDACARIEDGDLKCTDDWFIEMLKQYQQLIPYFQANSTGTAVEPAQQLFTSGKAAMLATGSYHIAPVRNLGAKFDIDMVFPVTQDRGADTVRGVNNSTFILSVSSISKNQPTAEAWVDFLTQPERAGEYANATAQHVSITGVEYTNPDLKRLQPWLEQETALAPRFQFLSLDVRNAVEASCVSVVSGEKPEKAAETAQRIVDQRR